MNQDALKRLIAARAGLLLDQALFGVPALRLRPVEDPSCQTGWTDGQSLGYNPTWLLEQTPAQLKAFWAHEVWHCAMGHPWRRDGRDHAEWNEAADRAINPVLRDSGFKLPDGALYELAPDHVGKSAEWIHARLPKKPKEPQSGGQKQGDKGEEPGGQQPGPGEQDDQRGQGQGQGQPEYKSELGEIRDAPKEAAPGQEAPPSEEDWRQMMQQAAAMARGRGQMPAGLERAVEKGLGSRIDWRPAMRRFAQEMARSDYSWVRPNPRYVAQGAYLPVLRSEAVGVLAVGLDTSGSVDLVLLADFGKEIQALADEIQPRQIVVFSCDAAVHKVEVFERGEEIVLHPAGGGGTDFRPVFKAVEEMEEPPVCVIYLTDLYGTFPTQDPGVPTLWVTAREGNPTVPFGEVLTVNS